MNLEFKFDTQLEFKSNTQVIQRRLYIFTLNLHSVHHISLIMDANLLRDILDFCKLFRIFQVFFQEKKKLHDGNIYSVSQRWNLTAAQVYLAILFF